MWPGKVKKGQKLRKNVQKWPFLLFFDIFFSAFDQELIAPNWIQPYQEIHQVSLCQIYNNLWRLEYFLTSSWWCHCYKVFPGLLSIPKQIYSRSIRMFCLYSKSQILHYSITHLAEWKPCIQMKLFPKKEMSTYYQHFKKIKLNYIHCKKCCFIFEIKMK